MMSVSGVMLKGISTCAHMRGRGKTSCAPPATARHPSPLLQFYKDGLALPATVIALEEGNMVTALRTEEKDGYTAVQVRGGAGGGGCGREHTPLGVVRD